jgi:hypothetical protein
MCFLSFVGFVMSKEWSCGRWPPLTFDRDAHRESRPDMAAQAEAQRPVLHCNLHAATIAPATLSQREGGKIVKLVLPVRVGAGPRNEP